MDQFLSVPWLFLLLSVRAVLPLNVRPLESVGITFLLLGLLGWAGPARVLRAAAHEIKSEDFMIQAKARGCRRWRILTMHLLPNVRPVLAAQFWMSIPIFILSEANLGFLGLGVAEPLPSWGNLLSGLQNTDAVTSFPWRLAPLVLLLVVMTCFHLVVPMEDFSK
jgi:peptide/nickel transport system permease protein